MPASAAGKQHNLVKIMPVRELYVPVAVNERTQPGNHNLGHAPVGAEQVTDAVSGHFLSHETNL
jgi:hypothetical protein